MRTISALFLAAATVGAGLGVSHQKARWLELVQQQTVQTINPAKLYPEYNLSVPIDHFKKHTPT
jgi:hypothetical protein